MGDNPSIEAQTYAPNIPETQLESTFSWAGLIGTILIFVMILGAAFWLLQRMNRKKFQGIHTPWFRVLDRQLLSPQHHIYLVEVAGKIQIWGSTDHQISQITEVNNPAQAADILEEIARRPEDPVDKLMKGMLPNRRRKGDNSKGPEKFSLQLKDISSLKDLNLLKKYSIKTNQKDIRQRRGSSRFQDASPQQSLRQWQESRAQQDSKGLESFYLGSRKNVTPKKKDAFSSRLEKMMIEDDEKQ